MSVYSELKNTSSGGGIYATVADLPVSEVVTGTKAYVSETNKLYFWSGSAWYSATLINTTPTITVGGNTTYALAADGTPTIVTLEANDPEGIPITWSYAVTAGSLGSIATVAQADNVFTITPSTIVAGDFTLTFTASDGVNLSTSASQFSLSFGVADSRYTILLLQAQEAGIASFSDASPENHTLPYSDVIQNSFNPYSSGYSAYLDGAGDYFAINSGTVANFGTGDFTIEMWWNRKDAVDPGLVFESRPVNTQGDYITLSILGANISYYAGSGAVNISTPHNVSVGDWAHLAVVRTGGYVKVYVNGTQIATSADTINYLSGSTPWIGKNAFQPEDWTNRISLSNYRITKAAAYTDNFTPSATPLGAITGTTLLTFQSNRFVDNSGNNVGLIVSGNPEVSAYSPFDHREYSQALQGISGYFSVNAQFVINASSDFVMDDGDFTMETWIYPTTEGVVRGIANTWDGGGAFIWDLNSSNLLRFQYTNTTSGVSSPFRVSQDAVITNQWSHIVVSRSGNNLYFFINGVLDSGGAQTMNDTMYYYNNSAKSLKIGGGADNTNFFTGWITDFRIVKGTGLYTSTFTPPIAPLTAVENTKFLMKAAVVPFIDKSQKANAIRKVGDIQGSSTQQLFESPTMNFIGSGYRMEIREGLPIPSGSSFTIEAWARPTGWSATTKEALFAFNGKSDGSNVLVYTGDGIYYGASSFPGSAPLSVNVWNHVAVTYDGTNLRSYVDGILRTTNAYTPSKPLEDCVFAIAAEFDSANAGTPGNYFNGYIQDVRVSTGLVRYTSNFTPPTALLGG